MNAWSGNPIWRPRWHPWWQPIHDICCNFFSFGVMMIILVFHRIKMISNKGKAVRFIVCFQKPVMLFYQVLGIRPIFCSFFCTQTCLWCLLAPKQRWKETVWLCESWWKQGITASYWFVVIKEVLNTSSKHKTNVWEEGKGLKWHYRSPQSFFFRWYG